MEHEVPVSYDETIPETIFGVVEVCSARLEAQARANLDHALTETIKDIVLNFKALIREEFEFNPSISLEEARQNALKRAREELAYSLKCPSAERREQDVLERLSAGDLEAPELPAELELALLEHYDEYSHRAADQLGGGPRRPRNTKDTSRTQVFSFRCIARVRQRGHARRRPSNTRCRGSRRSGSRASPGGGDGESDPPPESLARGVSGHLTRGRS